MFDQHPQRNKACKLSQQRSIFSRRSKDRTEKENEVLSSIRHNIYENSYKQTARNQNEELSENIQDTIDYEFTERDIKVFDKHNQSNFQTENIEDSFHSSSQILKNEDDTLEKYLMNHNESDIDDLLDLKINSELKVNKVADPLSSTVDEKEPLFTFNGTKEVI